MWETDSQLSPVERPAGFHGVREMAEGIPYAVEWRSTSAVRGRSAARLFPRLPDAFRERRRAVRARRRNGGAARHPGGPHPGGARTAGGNAAPRDGRRRLPCPEVLAEGRTEPLGRLISTLRAYHRAAVEPYWPHIRASVEADRALRGRALLDGGADELLATLPPMIRWRAPVLEADYPVDRELHLDGRGLLLQPSFFCRGTPVVYRDPRLPPVLVYPVTHPGAPASAEPGPWLGRLVGHTRSAVLRVHRQRLYDERTGPQDRGVAGLGEPARLRAARGRPRPHPAPRQLGPAHAHPAGRRAAQGRSPARRAVRSRCRRSDEFSAPPGLPLASARTERAGAPQSAGRKSGNHHDPAPDDLREPAGQGPRARRRTSSRSSATASTRSSATTRRPVWSSATRSSPC